MVGDGTPLLLLTAVGLLFAGGFAIFVGLRGEFLPHEARFLGMTEGELCRVAGCRVNAFMLHDRVAFGGALFSVGILYAYLALFPIRAGEAWAWWLYLVSGAVGFLSFLAVLGHGYLDTWHGLGTLVLLPLFAVGLIRTRTMCRRARRPWLWDVRSGLRTPAGVGWCCLLLGAGGAAVAGLEILRVGAMEIFVPKDLRFIGVAVDHLHMVSPRLVPLIAHDRAAFGGAVLTAGLTTLGCLLFTPVQRALWQAVLVAGTVSLTAAVAVHFEIGYVDAWHLAPPAAGMLSLLAGLALTYPAIRRRPVRPQDEVRQP